MLVVHAPNVHQGGGKMLLCQLLEAVDADATLCILDERLTLPDVGASFAGIERVKPSLFHRFLAELILRRVCSPDDTVVCFGNLPPLFHNLGNVFVFLQNRYLLSRGLNGLPWKPRLRLKVERLWLRMRLKNTTVVVQSESMAHETQETLGIKTVVAPFWKMTSPAKRMPEPSYDFVYVASGEPHKNHINLVAAWIELSKAGHRPSLALTLDDRSNPALVSWVVETSHRNGLDIKNLGQLSDEEVVSLYANCRALIYPSLFESFGLPLIEASRSGLPILAPEFDYVRDVVDPAETFDPESPVSISRAVRRFLGDSVAPADLLSPAEFVTFLRALASRP